MQSLSEDLTSEEDLDESWSSRIQIANSRRFWSVPPQPPLPRQKKLITISKNQARLGLFQKNNQINVGLPSYCILLTDCYNIVNLILFVISVVDNEECWQISKKEPPIIIFCITRTITYATSNLFSVRSPRGLVISFVSLFGAAQIWEKWLLLSRLAATVKTTKHMLALFGEKWQVNLRPTIRTGGASRKKTRKRQWLLLWRIK